MNTQNPSEKISVLLTKKRKIEERIRAMKASDSRERRRQDARLKIIVGALILRHRPELVASLLPHATERDRDFVQSALTNPNASSGQVGNQEHHD